MRRLIVLAFGAWLACPPMARADGPAGSWRMSVDLGGGRSFTVLVVFELKEKVWTGKYLASSEKDMQATVQDVKFEGDRLRFALNVGDQQLSFDGKAAAGGQRFAGTITIGNDLVLTALEASKLTGNDRPGLLKEIVAHESTGPALYNAAADLLKEATALKASPDEVRAWSDKAVRAAEPFGVRWQLVVTLRLVGALVDQANYVSVALPLAQRAERLLEPADEPTTQLPVLEPLYALLLQANKTDEAKAVATRISQLEERDEREEAARAPFQPQPFAGRQAASDRAVLVELFTGAECPPCVAADLAFDALKKAFRPAEVVCLQYHLHVPGPDPMTNPTTDARQRYYKVDGTPSIYFNGKSAAGGGGTPAAAAKKFGEYQKAISPVLETPSSVKLQLQAARTGERSSVSGESLSASSFPPHHATSEAWFRLRGTITSASRRSISTNAGSREGWLERPEEDWTNSCQTMMPARSQAS